jgi:hypothetical protein
MQHVASALLALLTLALITLAVGPAYAFEQAATVVGHPLVDTIFAYLGMLLTALTTLGAVLPRNWRFTQVIVRFSADLRGILTPDTDDDPDWAKRIRKDTGSLVIFAALVALPGCAFFRDSVAPAVVECAPDRQYLIDGLANILDGVSAFDELDRIKNEKGAEFVICTLQRFLDRVAVSPETAAQRARARAYLERK